jgi:acetylornithine/N-succinyldiaminopimelate aminotransferase
MLGVKCRVPNTELLGRLRDGGLLAATAADNVLRLLPPLTIGEAEVAEAVRIIEAAASDTAKAA